MDWLTFFAELAKALAWPVASVAMAFVFREQIQTLLGRVKKGKFGPAEFEFEERLRELQEQEEELPPTTAEKSSIQQPGALQVIAEPRGVVLEAWLKVEAAMDALAKKSGKVNALLTGSPLVAKHLRKIGVLDPELYSLYQELLKLRNRAAHEQNFSPTVESVFAYVRLAQHVEAFLKSAADGL